MIYNTRTLSYFSVAKVIEVAPNAAQEHAMAMFSNIPGILAAKSWLSLLYFLHLLEDFLLVDGGMASGDCIYLGHYNVSQDVAMQQVPIGYILSGRLVISTARPVHDWREHMSTEERWTRSDTRARPIPLSAERLEQDVIPLAMNLSWRVDISDQKSFAAKDA